MNIKQKIVENATYLLTLLINKLPHNCKSTCCNSECTN